MYFKGFISEQKIRWMPKTIYSEIPLYKLIYGIPEDRKHDNSFAVSCYFKK